uniref:BTB domain-containing protein n=1 Tax=Ornithorhynchus anatinus TaxID=9258 RepID=A0A6I8NDD1_ORNAN
MGGLGSRILGLGPGPGAAAGGCAASSSSSSSAAAAASASPCPCCARTKRKRSCGERPDRHAHHDDDDDDEDEEEDEEEEEGRPEKRPRRRLLHSPWRKRMGSTANYIYQTLFLNGENSDIKICALGEEWSLHKLYLRQSGYFSSMFCGSWKESTVDVIELEIPDGNIDTEALQVAFGSLYRDDVLVESSRVISVLAAACMLQLVPRLAPQQPDDPAECRALQGAEPKPRVAAHLLFQPLRHASGNGCVHHPQEVDVPAVGTFLEWILKRALNGSRRLVCQVEERVLRRGRLPRVGAREDFPAGVPAAEAAVHRRRPGVGQDRGERRPDTFGLRLASFDGNGKLICSRTTGYRILTLEKDQEQAVMTLDGRLSVFPLYISCNFMYVSSEKEGPAGRPETPRD